jgi:ferredoxin-type protein NapH
VSGQDEQSSVRLGPNGKPVRPFILPDTLGGKLSVWRYIILRRIVQFGVLLLFFGTVHWGWQIAGKPLLTGNLSGSSLLDTIPMADPFATLQMFLTQHVLENEVIIGALIMLVFYAIVGGRVWCSWVCPINMVTDLANWLRIKLGITNTIPVKRNLRYAVMVMALVLSVLTGVAAFEWVSPISMVHRGLIYGIGAGWTAVLGIFLFDLLILKHGWCGHLCPLGAFYGVVGKVAQLRIDFNTPTCTHCGECAKVCPEPQVLNLKKASEAGMVASGECTNCGRCITVCPEDTLSFQLRARIHPDKSSQSSPALTRTTEENAT